MKTEIGPLVGILRQLATVVASLSPRQYTARPGEFTDGTIGGHVRHCLDHVEALVLAAATGQIDYDRRVRGTEIETDPRAALDRIRALEGRLLGLPAWTMGRPLTLRGVLTPSSPAVEMQTSFAREMAYVLSHTTHHNAIIGYLVRGAGGKTPDHFGYAASTLAYLAEPRCAP